MLKIADLKHGDIISVNDEGIEQRRNRCQSQTMKNIRPWWIMAYRNSGIDQEDMQAIPLDENQLAKLGFTKEDLDGGVKY